jgi:hypothetical protein
MDDDNDDWDIKLNKVYLQQQAIKRYILLINLEESELTLDDILFIENFKFTLYFWSSTQIKLYIKEFYHLQKSYD